MNILYLIYNGGEQMRYLSVTEIAKNGMCRNVVSEITVLRDE